MQLQKSPSPVLQETPAPKRGVLKKSKSLDLDQSVDLRRQLEVVQHETNLLKDKMVELDKGNGMLLAENKRLQLHASRQMPSIQTDDAAVQNIELKDKLKELETENNHLREKIKTLDARTNKLSKQVIKTQDKDEGLDDSEESRDLKDQLHQVEEECAALRKKMTELEAQNNRMATELAKYTGGKEEEEAGDAKQTMDFNLSTASKLQLREKIKDLYSELREYIYQFYYISNNIT